MIFNSVKLSTMLRRGAYSLLLLGTVIFASVLNSCESVYDNPVDCRTGLALRFVYDYHLEPGANAFPANVDCISVYVFDENGNYLQTITETSDVLRDESYRMEFPLDLGKYKLIVYGGTACPDATFDFAPSSWNEGRAGGTPDDIRVTLPLENGVSAKKLHDIKERTGGLFYGTLEVEIKDEDYDSRYREETVYMMKDTNNIQVILQELSSPYQIDYNDYEFKIVDDNFILDGENNAVSVATESYQPIYSPYAGENRIAGYVDPVMRDGAQVYEDESRPVQVGCVEFSTSRLFVDHLHTARLVVISKKEHEDDGSNRVIINIPLITYLAATRGFGYNWIRTDQEYLDRQSNWTLMFFLRKGAYVSTVIAVNSWIVRINDIELEE